MKIGERQPILVIIEKIKSPSEPNYKLRKFLFSTVQI